MKKLIPLIAAAALGLSLLGSGPSAQAVSAVGTPAASVRAVPPAQATTSTTEAPAPVAIEVPAEPATAPAAPVPPAQATAEPVADEAPTAADVPAEPAPAADPYCPKDGTVYAAGSCVLDPSVMPSGAAEGTPVKYCSGNSECPADYPDPGPGNALQDCQTTAYQTCDSYNP